MHATTLLCALAVSVSPVFAIPPESFGFPSAPNDTALTVVYNHNGDTTTVTEANLFGLNVPAMQPTVAVNTAQYRSLANYMGAYVIMMVDPDASTPQNPSKRFILHWMQPNMTASTTTADSGMAQVLTNSTPAVVPYASPMPPVTSDAHRYILYAFQQPADFAVPAAFSGYNAMNRSSFDLTEFISAASLGTPAAAEFYFCSAKSSVPPNFVGAPGGTYPGGNGGLVTDGPGPATTTSGSASAASSSMTSAANVVSGNTMTVLLAMLGACVFYTL